MKKCVFAGDWVLEQAVGIQRYTLQILLELDKMLLDGRIDLEIELLVPKSSGWKNPFKKITVVELGKIGSKVEKYIWQQLVFPIYVTKKKAIGVDLAGAVPIWGCRICALHDCIREIFPENFDRHKFYLKMYYFKARCVAKSSKVQIVTLTHDSMKEVQNYYHVPDNRIVIVSCGWEHMNTTTEDDSILNRLELNDGCEFFFSLGSKYKHKNFRWILESARYNPKYKFVITGTGAFSNNENELKMVVPKNVIFTGYITNEEIKSLMIHCKALIQPSLYEGFGLPPLEALSVGASIVVSNKSCLPEIYKGVAHYIDPYNYNVDLDKLMDESVDDPKIVLDEYTWERAAAQLLNVLYKEGNR